MSSKGEKKGKTDDEGTTPNLIRPKTQKVQFSSVVGANNIFVLDSMAFVSAQMTCSASSFGEASLLFKLEIF